MDWKRVLIGKWSWKRPFQSLIAIYLMLFVVAVFFADRLIFQPPLPSYGPELPGLVHLRGVASEDVAAVYYPAARAMPTVLFSHGNAEDLGQAMELYEEWRERGLGVLAYDYPGYGMSSGKTDEESCYRAIDAAWKYLLAQGVPPKQIVIVSRSVGGGPGTWLASREPAAGLVLVSPFTSAFRVPFPFPLFPCDRFRNLERIRSIRTPLLVIHGENDEVIPFSHGRELFEACPAQDKRFVPIAGGRHNDLFEVAGDEILRETTEFARRLVK